MSKAEHSDKVLAAIACSHLSISDLTEREVYQLTSAVRHFEQDGRLALSERAAIFGVIYRYMETITL